MTRLTTSDLHYTAEVFRALIVHYDETDYVSDLHYTAEVYRALIVHYDETDDD